MTKNFYCFTESPLGKLTLTSNGKELMGIYLSNDPAYPLIKKDYTENKALFLDEIQQIKEYFDGTRTKFQLKYTLNGRTPLLNQAWHALTEIPYGTTISYSALSKKIWGRSNAARAVGGLVGKNPLCIIVPCHRVIREQGGIGGYRGGLEAKKWLLAHEQSVSSRTPLA